MEKLLLAFLILLQSTYYEEYYLILECCFDEDKVTIILNESRLFQETVTTDFSMGLASEIKFKSGAHLPFTIKVVVNDSLTLSQSIHPDSLKSNYFGLTLQQERIELHNYNELPVYD
jgi:hypothetical protein